MKTRALVIVIVLAVTCGAAVWQYRAAEVQRVETSMLRVNRLLADADRATCARDGRAAAEALSQVDAELKWLKSQPQAALQKARQRVPAADQSQPLCERQASR